MAKSTIAQPNNISHHFVVDSCHCRLCICTNSPLTWKSRSRSPKVHALSMFDKIPCLWAMECYGILLGMVIKLQVQVCLGAFHTQPKSWTLLKTKLYHGAKFWSCRKIIKYQIGNFLNILMKKIATPRQEFGFLFLCTQTLLERPNSWRQNSQKELQFQGLRSLAPSVKPHGWIAKITWPLASSLKRPVVFFCEPSPKFQGRGPSNSGTVQCEVLQGPGELW